MVPSGFRPERFETFCAPPHASGDRFGLFFRRLLDTNTNFGANVGGVTTANDPSPPVLFPFPSLSPSALVFALFALDPDPARLAVAGVAGSLFTPNGGARFAPRLLGVGVSSPPVPPSPPSVSGLGDASFAEVVRSLDASEGVRGLPRDDLSAPRAPVRLFSAGSSFATFAPFAPFVADVLVADGLGFAGSSTAAAAASSDGVMFAPEETLHEMLQKSLASACSVLWQWRHARARAAPRPLADPPFPRGCGRSERNTTRALLMT